jgi:tetratricopeptide (TPR) repeat protein
VEQTYLFRPPVDEAGVTAMFDVAHANSPNLGKVTYYCANGAWRRYLRSVAGGEADDSSRDRALALYRESIRQNPLRALDVFAHLWPQLPDPLRLRDMTPNHLISHEQLYDFLLARGLFSDCHDQLRVLKELNRTRPTVADDADSLSAFDMGRISKRTREDVAASILKREAFILGMLERWDEREQLIATESHRLVDALLPRLEQAEALMADGKFVRAEMVLKRVLNEAPGFSRAILANAKLLRASGRHMEAARALANLLYRNAYAPVPDDLLADALALARDLQTLCQMEDGAFPIHKFVTLALQAATPVDDAERGLKGTERGLKELSDALTAGRVAWTQSPFVHVTLGDVRRHLGDRAGADVAYDRALDEHPHLWYALQRRSVTVGASAHLTAQLAQSIPLQTDFGGRIRVMGYQCIPSTIDRSQPVTIRYHLLCLADVSRDLQALVRFRHAGQVVFSDRIKPGHDGRETLSWKVGEWITLEHTVYPFRRAVDARKRLMPGRYDLEISFVNQGGTRPALLPAVPARGPAFELKR